jgi:hypothetical protein
MPNPDNLVSSNGIDDWDEESGRPTRSWPSAIWVAGGLITLYWASSVAGDAFGRWLTVVGHAVFFLVLVLRPQFIVFLILVVVPFRLPLDLVSTPVGPFHMLWYEVALLACLLRIVVDLARHQVKGKLFFGSFLVALGSTSQSMLKGFSRAFLPGVVLRDAIGCFLVGFFYAAQFVKRTVQLSTIVRYVATVWIVGFWIRVFVAVTGLDSTALGVFYGDQAGVLSSFSVSYLLFKALRQENQLKRFSAYFNVVSIIAVTMASGGRIATIAVILAALLSLWQNGKAKISVRSRVKQVLVFIVLVSAVWILGLLPDQASRRFNELFSGASSQLSTGLWISTPSDIGFEGTARWRMAVAFGAIANWSDEPLTGIGWGTPLRLEGITPTMVGPDPLASYIRAGTIHITPLIILTGSGILGFLGLSFFLWRTLAYVLKNSREGFGVEGKILLLPVMVSGFVISLAQPVFASVNAAWLWSMYGLWFRFSSLSETQKEEFIRFL